MRNATFAAAALVCLSNTAIADEFNGLSFVGDGTTPSAMELYERNKIAAQAGRYAASAGARGEATYSMPIETMPALLAPSIQLTYSSNGGHHSYLGRGFSLSAGPRIERPSVRQEVNAYADVPGVLRISGGPDGMLVPNAGAPQLYDFVANGSIAASATVVGDVAIVRHGGLRTEFQPWGRSWLPVEQTDEQGNAITWHWTDGRLDSIDYGHNVDLPDAHQLTVEFVYAPTAPMVSYAPGFAHSIAERLEAVVVTNVQTGEGWRYDLFYGEFLGSEQLVEVERSFADGTDPHVLATLSYTDYDPELDEVFFTSDEDFAALPPVLDGTLSAIPKRGMSYDPVGGRSLSVSMFADASGDGLPDFIDLADEDDPGIGWFQYQPVGDDLVPSWEAGRRPDGLDVPVTRSMMWQSSGTPNGDPRMENHGRYAASRIADVDGDGFPDFLVNDVARNSHLEDHNDQHFDDPNIGVDSSSWRIRYGGPNGLESSHDVGAPTRWMQASSGKKTYLDSDTDEVLGAAIDLVDMNGDGWLDVVFADTTTREPDSPGLRVWYKHPARGAGWSEVEHTPLAGPDFADLRYEMQALAISELEYRTQDFPGQLTARSVAYTNQTHGLVDLNGDGFPDFVHAASDAIWEVWFGTGDGFEPWPTNWDAPLAMLSRSNEAITSTRTCVVPALPQIEVQNEGFDTQWAFDDGFAPVPGDTMSCSATPPDEPPNRRSPGSNQQQFVPYQGLQFECEVTPGEDEDPFLDSFAEESPAFVQQSIGGEIVLVAEGGAGCHSEYGKGGTIDIGLQDMDGDGLVDLVAADLGWWYRNLGNGFDSGRLVPYGFPGSLADTRVSQTTFVLPNGTGGAAAGTSRTIQMVLDVDGNGLPDVIGSELDPDYATISLSSYSKPGLLESVTTRTGAKTTLAYTPSSYAWPAGSDPGSSAFDPSRPHQMASHTDLVGEISVLDTVTKVRGRRRFNFNGGVCEGGLCQGFRSRVVRELRKDPYDGLRPTALVATTYEVDRDFAVPEVERTWLNAELPNGRLDSGRLGQVPGFGFIDGQAHWLPVREETSTWLDDTPVASVGRRLLDRLDVHEYTDADTLQDRDLSWSMTYDTWGNVTKVVYDQPTRPEDRVEVRTTWIGSLDETHFRPSQQTTRSFDVIGQSEVTVEKMKFGYDGQDFDATTLGGGLLTRARVCSGPIGDLCAEGQTWFFDHTARGAIAAIDGPPGEDMVFGEHAFGDAVWKTSTNALDHATERVVDGVGRIITTKHPTAVSDGATFDSLGRPLVEWRQGKDGPSFDTRTYEYGPDGSFHEVRIDDLDVDGTPLRTEWQVLDGFGDVVVSTRSSDVPLEGISTVTVRDVAGNVIVSGFPKRHSLLPVGTEPPEDPHHFTIEMDSVRRVEIPGLTVTNATTFEENGVTLWNGIIVDEADIFGRVEFDGLGRARRTWRNYADAPTAVKTTRFPGPGIEVVQDEGFVDVETGATRSYTHRSTRDGLGRLIKVEEGTNGVSTTADYRYDGRDRLVRFIDAAGNGYRYTFDGAGRLQQSERRPTNGVWADYTSFTYDGPFPMELFRAGELAATWTRDELGRVEGLDLTDDNGTTSYTIEWDTAWVGSRTYMEDPSGRTDWFYDDAGDGLGQLGRVSRAVRSWADPALAGDNTLLELDFADAIFDFTYTFDGKTASTVWPSGTIVDTTWRGDWRISDEVHDGVVSIASVLHDYDDYGLPGGWTGGPLTVHVDRRDPDQVERIWINQSDVDLAVTYEHHPNGLMREKRHLGLPFVNEDLDLRFGYDELLRLRSVNNDAGEVETYAYDAIGNPTAMARGGETFTYSPAAGFNEIADRISSGGVHEQHVWDAGRSFLKKLKTDTNGDGSFEQNLVFGYDGLGRVERIERRKGENRDTYFHYDFDDQMVAEYDQESQRTVLRFDGLWWDYTNGRQIESILPGLKLDDGQPRWSVIEPDGHAVAAFDDAGGQLKLDVLGAYGQPIFQEGGVFVLDGFHGQELQEDHQVVQMGVRHMLPRDGMWLQPEPLLRTGAIADLRDPLGMSGAYAAANPTIFEDRSGANPFLIKTVAKQVVKRALGEAVVTAAETAVETGLNAVCNPCGTVTVFALSVVDPGDWVDGSLARKALKLRSKMAAPSVSSVTNRVGGVGSVGTVPKPPRGRGSVPKAKRDTPRLFPNKDRDAKIKEQGGECGTGCGTKIQRPGNARGHHIKRHADGGKTDSPNHVEVCEECHKKLHAP